jgi:DNA-binding FrmR family transcriptional regulator
MNGTSSTIERRNQRISARLRRIQGQIVALERSLEKEPEFTVLLQRAAAARGAMSGLIADLMEERLRSLQVISESDEARGRSCRDDRYCPRLSHLIFIGDVSRLLHFKESFPTLKGWRRALDRDVLAT